ncbi:MAG: hypothetical protein R3346_03085 [Candidatus Spechtbacterales bacterium]|nr:hypothetical protein [Candidatus Spechtbacterales bacterium]
MNNVDDKTITIGRDLFRTAILAVLTIFATYIVGFLVPSATVTFRPEAGSFVQSLFFNTYSFAGVALVASLVFWHSLKKYSKHPHLVMVFLYATLLLLMPLVNYQELLIGYASMLIVSLSYVFLSGLVYAIFNYVFPKQRALAATVVSVVLATIWFLI